jgi:hypothetical protein
MFVGKARSLSYSGVPARCFTRVSSSLARKHLTKLERLARDKHSNLLWKVVTYGHKSFITLAPVWMILLVRCQLGWIFWSRWNQLSWKLSDEIFLLCHCFTKQMIFSYILPGLPRWLFPKVVTYGRKKFYNIGHRLKIRKYHLIYAWLRFSFNKIIQHRFCWCGKRWINVLKPTKIKSLINHGPISS